MVDMLTLCRVTTVSLLGLMSVIGLLPSKVYAPRPPICDFPKTSVPRVHARLPPRRDSIVGRSLDLRCCASGFVNITWRSDGETVDSRSGWYESVHENGQVLHIKGLLNREKLISCDILWPNGTSTHYKTVIKPYECREEEKPSHVEPKKANFWVRLGRVKEVYCGFRVPCEADGRIDWYKLNGEQNESSIIPDCDEESPRSIAQNRVCRETSQRYLFGAGVRSRLIIENVRRDHLGQYMCVLTKFSHLNATISLAEQAPPPVVWETIKDIVIGVGTSVSAAITVLLCVIMYCWLDIKLTYKDRFKQWDEVDKKDYDAYILYCKREHGGDGKDQTFACDVLAKTLSEEYNYRVFIDEKDLMVGGSIADDYHDNIRRSSCLVMMASDAFFSNDWCRFVLQGHAHLNKLKKVFVVHQQISDQIWDEKDALRDVFYGTKKVYWPGATISTLEQKRCKSFRWVQKIVKNPEKQFWKKLRLQLPPRNQVLKKQKSSAGLKEKSYLGKNEGNSASQSSASSRYPLLHGSSSARSPDGAVQYAQPDFKNQTVKSKPAQLVRQSTLSDEVFL